MSGEDLRAVLAMDLEPIQARKLLADGREALVVPLTYGRARLTVGPPGEYADAW